jgi:hypothetical protein
MRKGVESWCMAGKVHQIARGLAARFAVLRTRDPARNGVPRRCLVELVETGLLERSGRRMYQSTLRFAGQNRTLVKVARQSQRAVKLGGS